MEFRVIIGAAMIFSEITMIVLGKPTPKSAYIRRDPRDNPYAGSFNYEPVHFDDKIRPTSADLYSPKTAGLGPRPVVHSLNVRPWSQNLSTIYENDTNPSSIPTPPKLKKSPGSGECPPLRRHAILRKEFDISSPEMISLPDPFRYLVEKAMKLSTPISWTKTEVDRLLRFDRLPQCYIPLAKALSSLLQCWTDVEATKQVIRIIQKLFPASNTDLSFLPTDILSSMSPELLQLFSDDLLRDPEPPLRLFHSLLDMPSSIRNLEEQLKEFIEKTNQISINSPRNQQYIRYARAVWEFIRNESAFDNLKTEMAAIKQT